MSLALCTSYILHLNKFGRLIWSLMCSSDQVSGLCEWMFELVGSYTLKTLVILKVLKLVTEV